MRRGNKTSLGSGHDKFRTTCWSEILSARTDDETKRRIIVGDLMGRYWRPVYCYLLRKGYENETAKDLTQGFFCEIVFGRGLIQKADRAKGRFRTFLLTALDRYVVSVRRRETRRKARPRHGFVEWEQLELGNLMPPDSAGTPEAAFYYGWVADLLDRVLAEVQEEYCGTESAAHWEVFRMKVLDPIMLDAEEPSLAEICATLGVSDESRASNMIITVKRRYRAILRRRLRELVESGADVEQELKDIFSVLSEYGAG